MPETRDLIAETERHLLGAGGPERNYLAAGITAEAASLTLELPAGNITAGSRLSIGLEMFHVKSVTGTTVSVVAGQEGSTSASHDTGEAILVNPAYSWWSILQALNAELRSLSSPANGLFQMKTKDLTYDGSILGYDLGARVDGFLDVYRVLWKQTGVSKSWPEVSDFRVERNMLKSDFSSGVAVFITGASSQQPARVIYKAPFDLLENLDDDVATVTGLPSTAVDLPPLGAAERLVSMNEVRRNALDAQSSSKRLDEVPAGAQRQAATALRVLRERRVREEATRLRAMYPVRRW
jgi:hypothetical protein